MSEPTPVSAVDAATPRGAAVTVREIVTDIAVGLMWAALVVAIVLFSGSVSQFVYVDF